MQIIVITMLAINLNIIQNTECGSRSEKNISDSFGYSYEENISSKTSLTWRKSYSSVLSQLHPSRKSELRYMRSSHIVNCIAPVICANQICNKNCHFHRKEAVHTGNFSSFAQALITALTKLIMHGRFQIRLLLMLFIVSYLICPYQAILIEGSNPASGTKDSIKQLIQSSNGTVTRNIGKTLGNYNNNSTPGENIITSSGTSVAGNGYLDTLERSLADALMKVAYGTTSTTKRSIPDNSYLLGLTTAATPLLTTLRYQSTHQKQSANGRHRNYELDLERDHALPTSAPNADILKSNNNPTYPNPNRHHSHERDRHRHIYNSTSMPSVPNLLKKSSSQPPTIPMYSGDIPSYSPPSRSFFTPPLPPEYQNPFADKPTLRGTNNEGQIANTGIYINRRPIPPPSLMPGHERIPLRPPDLAASTGSGDLNVSFINAGESKKPVSITTIGTADIEHKKALNTPSRLNDAGEVNRNYINEQGNSSKQLEISSLKDTDIGNKLQGVLPNIKRILSGSNRSDIPDVFLKHVTQRPILSYHLSPSSPIVLIENSAKESMSSDSFASNINQSKQMPGQADFNEMHDIATSKPKSSMHLHEKVGNNGSHSVIATTPSAYAAVSDASATLSSNPTTGLNDAKHSPTFSSSNTQPSGVSAAAAEASAHTIWTWAWNIHIYLSVVLFTILSVYSLYKMLTYNKLTHLFSQSYFICIHLILIVICITRIFYLCFDAYNIHGSFHIFAAELLLNLPSTFLTVSFSVLILYLFLKSLNHKNNRYSALIRPLTVVVGCGVHIVLCITLHYVESYTMQNHHIYLQQQQQHQFYRRQHQQQNFLHVTISPTPTLAGPPPPPRVLTLICQIIYIFICLSLGMLYLYLYRILKGILRSKSQNYIHGYQNLSYAIHITIATALLFVLLAALQIFGAVCISSARSLITQANIEVDWLQWGYQFSLRLIEIAIITLISWVTGLKTRVGNNGGVSMNTDTRVTSGSTPNGGNGVREKHSSHNHSNVANFFLPCTSSSSQEQFETDYPAICNANTNLHTYTMRTGKLIYDDSYALNSLGPSASPGAHTNSRGGTCAEYQLQEPMYQRPYDTGSIRSAVNHNITDYASQPPGQRYNLCSGRDSVPYGDYMTDVTTDHYENPNFDLRGSLSVTGSASAVNSGGTMQNMNKNTTSSTTASSGGSGSSGISQQQMLLLQSDSCYSEPLHENSSYEFHNFERPTFKENPDKTATLNDECWPERPKHTKYREQKSNNTLEHVDHEKTEKRSSNSTNSCSSSNTGGRYASYNSCDRGYYNGVRKSGTLNNIVNNNTGRGRPIPAKSNQINAAHRTSGAQTLALSDRQHYYQKNDVLKSRGMATNDLCGLTGNETVHSYPVNKNESLQRYHHNSEDEEEDDMISVSNVECTNLINNEHGSCLANDSNNLISAYGNNIDQGFGMNELAKGAGVQLQLQQEPHTKIDKITHSHDPHLHVQNNPKLMQLQFIQEPSMQSSEVSAASSVSASSNSCRTSSASDSMLVAEKGFLRFRALDDGNIGSNIGQTVAIHNASMRHQSRSTTANPSATNCSISGINC